MATPSRKVSRADVRTANAIVALGCNDVYTPPPCAMQTLGCVGHDSSLFQRWKESPCLTHLFGRLVLCGVALSLRAMVV
jgi:hypothetical protein